MIITHPEKVDKTNTARLAHWRFNCLEHSACPCVESPLLIPAGLGHLNPRRLGRDLMVGAVVMGRLVKMDGGLTVSAELVNTADGSVLWCEQYRSRQTNLLAIYQEISREIEHSG